MRNKSLERRLLAKQFLRTFIISAFALDYVFIMGCIWLFFGLLPVCLLFVGTVIFCLWVFMRLYIDLAEHL